MSGSTGSDWPYPGARWWKVDFHVHTPASKDTRNWQKAIGTRDEVTPERWLLQCMGAGLDCVAVTDHNTGEWIDRLKEAYADLEVNPPEGFRPLHLFPGVELSVNGGFHLLALFDLEKSSSEIDTLLGAVEYDGRKGHADGVTRKSAIEVIEKVLAARGLPIPAHVDGEKGLLRVLSSESNQAALDAGTVLQVLRYEEILAMEVIDQSVPRPGIYIDSGCTWTEILGSDCHSFRNRGLGSRFTWVKMERPSLEGLRLALLDGERFSIRRSDAPEAFRPEDLPAHLIESIHIADAQFMGRGVDAAAELDFSPWLNALVGGRGTGKSTVVHFLRLGYRRGEELDTLGDESETRRVFKRFDHVPHSRDDHGGLLPGTEALLTVRRDGVRHLIRWRQDGTGPIVEEEANGEWRRSASQQVTPDRFPVRLFSQGQIAALAGESQEALLGVIDEAAKCGRRKEAIAEAKRRYFALRSQIRELEGKLEARDRLAVELEDVLRKLRHFEAAHHADVLKTYQLRTRQEREIQRQVAAAGALAGRIESLASEIAPEELPERLFDSEREEDQNARAQVDLLHEAIRQTGEALEEAARQLRNAAQRERTALEASSWQVDVDRAKDAYDKLVSTLREEDVADPSEYGKLVQDRHRLEQEKERFESLRAERARLVTEAQAQQERVLELRRELSAARARFLDASLRENPYVRIELVPYGRDWRQMERSLREVLEVLDDRFADDICKLEGGRPSSGLVPELIAAADRRVEWSRAEQDQRVGEDPMESELAKLKRKIEAACEGLGRFGGHFNNYFERECERKPELLDRLLTWFPEDSLKVEHSRTGDGGEFRPIEQGSAGQRAAAMLAFLLAHGEEPLILDQPEDDLDNHLIYDLVVRQIRDNKRRRQIIVVTHNPNIVVNGDAEMVHALSFAGGQCRVTQQGSLQEVAMRDEVCQIMEGGREAFERRYRRLGRKV